MLVVGRRLFPWLLWQVARTGSRELFTLCVIAAAVGIAYGSARAVRRLVRARRVLRRHGAARVRRSATARPTESLPLRDAFSVLFFVSVGMLFDPQVAGRRAAARAGRARRSSCSASRSPRSCWCSPSAIRSTPRSRSRRAWRRSASSRSSWPASASRSAAAGRRAEPDPGRRADLDRAQPAAVRRRSSRSQRWIRRALEARPRARAPRRSAGRAADDGRLAARSPATWCWSATAASGARIAEALAEQRHARSSSPSRTASWSRSCASAACPRSPATPPSRRC